MDGYLKLQIAFSHLPGTVTLDGPRKSGVRSVRTAFSSDDDNDTDLGRNQPPES